MLYNNSTLLPFTNNLQRERKAVKTPENLPIDDSEEQLNSSPNSPLVHCTRSNKVYNNVSK